jgi:hypothetical protein
MEQTVAEIKRLQGCINDPISALALPVMWNGHEPSEIVRTLLDALLGMLRLDFVYARLCEVIDGTPIEVLRSAQHCHLAVPPQEVDRALHRWLTGDLSGVLCVVPNPLGSGEVTIASLRLGLQDEGGVVVAASQRTDFPTQTERILS